MHIAYLLLLGWIIKNASSSLSHKKTLRLLLGSSFYYIYKYHLIYIICEKWV